MRTLKFQPTSGSSTKPLVIRIALMVTAALVMSVAISDALLAQATLSSHQRTAAQRDTEFSELTKHASFIEQQYRQVKRIAKFVKPTVVHIDAKKREASSLSKSKDSKRICVR